MDREQFEGYRWDCVCPVGPINDLPSRRRKHAAPLFGFPPRPHRRAENASRLNYIGLMLNRLSMTAVRSSAINREIIIRGEIEKKKTSTATW